MKKAMLCILMIFPAILTLSIGPATGSEYFPLKEGLQWEYRVEMKQSDANISAKMLCTVQPPRKLNDQTVSVYHGVISAVETDDEILSLSLFFHESEQGLRIVAEQESGNAEPKLDEDWEFKFPLIAGNSWTEEDEFSLDNNKFHVAVTDTIEEMNAVVTVPAGTFEKCMKINGYFSGKVNLGSYGGSPEVTIENETWYAPGVGPVKACERMKSNKPGFESSEFCMELTSFKK